VKRAGRGKARGARADDDDLRPCDSIEQAPS
jgi:hypothetical protein